MEFCGPSNVRSYVPRERRAPDDLVACDSPTKKRMPRLLSLLLCLTAVNLGFAFFVITYEHHHLHKENHALENLQAMLLAVGTVVYLIPRIGIPLLPPLSIAMSLLCFSFLLRELDVERLDVPVFLHWIGSGIGKRILLAVLWLAMLQRIYRASCDGNIDWQPLIFSRLSLCVAAVLGLLILGYGMDREVFPLAHTRLYEEMAETNAYFLLIGACFLEQTPRATARMSRQGL